MSARKSTRSSSATVSGSNVPLIGPRQCSDGRVVSEILRVLAEVMPFFKGDANPRLLKKRCEYHITKSTWELFVRFIELHPYYRKMSPLDQYPDELAPFEEQRKDIGTFVETTSYLEYDLDRNWLFIQVTPDTDLKEELRWRTLAYVTEKVTEIFRGHFVKYIVKCDKNYKLQEEDAVYYIDACISCHEKRDKYLRWRPALILDFGFKESLKEDRFQALMKKGKGATLCILSLNIGYDGDFESPPKVQLKVWTAVTNLEQSNWGPQLIMSETNLRAKVRDDPKASLKLYPYDVERDIDIELCTAEETVIAISFQRLLEFVDEAWKGDSLATRHPGPVFPKRLPGEREKWISNKRIRKV
ncbi:hypothetical protein ABKA04_009632 [Annulohypoxylon sp. FPYF3050]